MLPALEVLCLNHWAVRFPSDGFLSWFVFFSALSRILNFSFRVHSNAKVKKDLQQFLAKLYLCMFSFAGSL